LYRFAAERDKELVSAGLLGSNFQYERSVLLVDQLTERWFHRSFARRQQLTYNIMHLTQLETTNNNRFTALCPGLVPG